MQVPFHLRRRATGLPADALLLLFHDNTELLRLCAAMHWQKLPPIFAVADGYVLRLSQPLTTPFIGAIKLRELGANLYIPIDAELLPALLPDEAAALARRCGLVFLPGGRVLEFDPTKPVLLSTIVKADNLQRDSWRPLPESEQWADRLTEISLLVPELPPDELLSQGGEDIGTEPLPELSNLPRRMLGKAAFGAGKAMAWMGTLFGLKGLARAGMKLMESGLGMSPKMARSVLGAQEAKLRALLKAFREGNVERAMRRALPLGADTRGDVLATNANLPFHKLFYSLRNLLGDSGGRASVWFPGVDILTELSNEYRRQAALAVERGDYRRAAFIHAKLLHDFASAAGALAKGGLHRDAAIIYLRRVGDTMAAAREYEAAGEVEKALGLYHQRGDYLQAGDLLRRIGDEERALAEYDTAARQALRSGSGYYEAGEILRVRAGREDLALPFYQTGWNERPSGNPLPCGMRLMKTHASTDAIPDLFQVVTEADAYLQPAGNDLRAAEFYSDLAHLAGQLRQPRDQDNLRDRALMGLASKLRQRVKTGAGTSAVTNSMLSSLHGWPAPTVTDAQYALRQAYKIKRPLRKKQDSSEQRSAEARKRTVTAICCAIDSGDIFLGFDSGEVVWLGPDRTGVVAVTNEHCQILSLAATHDGDAVVVMTSQSPGEITLKSFVKNVIFTLKGTTTMRDSAGLELCSNLAGNRKRFMFATWVDTDFQFMEGPQFVPTCHAEFRGKGGTPEAVLLLPTEQVGAASVPLLALCDRWITHCNNPPWPVNDDLNAYVGMSLGSSVNSGLLRHFSSWGNAGKWLELAAVTCEGDLYTSAIRLDNSKTVNAVVQATSSEAPYLTAAVLGPDRFAGVTATAVHWLRRGGNGLHIIAETGPALPSAIAAFRHPRAKELIVISADGSVTWVPAPGV